MEEVHSDGCVTDSQWDNWTNPFSVISKIPCAGIQSCRVQRHRPRGRAQPLPSVMAGNLVEFEYYQYSSTQGLIGCECIWFKDLKLLSYSKTHGIKPQARLHVATDVSNLDANLDMYFGLFFIMTQVSNQDEVLSYFYHFWQCKRLVILLEQYNTHNGFY